jgi:redox-sensitive bicupin YhaK (pirin superfamily)
MESIWLRSPAGNIEPGHEQKRFSLADRRNGLCLVASPDGRKDSLSVHQDAFIFSAILEPGRHVTHELTPLRSGWLHVLSGEGTVDDVTLTAGDGANATNEASLSFTAVGQTEILLLDFGEN